MQRATLAVDRPSARMSTKPAAPASREFSHRATFRAMDTRVSVAMDARAKKLAVCCACAMACIAVARARADGATWPDLSSGPLQDNSFLIEEAYNQEAGVVQSIVNGLWSRSSENWTLSFTQEWPVPDQRHQFSYTLL